MDSPSSPDAPIAVIGLGYVGLPLAVVLARRFAVVGFDVDAGRVAELTRGFDRTGEIDAATLGATALHVSSDPAALAAVDTFIVTVPTPVDAANRPDLGAVLGACDTVGAVLRPGATVVFESTVYPGVTEDICGPRLEARSGLRCGVDFFLGYSPERINPGDRTHTVDKIAKVVAGQTPEVARRLAALYGAINGGNVFVAKDIRTAEAAKVIENAQRDINIAFVNEVTQVFHDAGLSIHDVLAAARTKWNFLDFRPGFVGGHCIGVDPYYLAHWAVERGHDPQIILAGRRLNDGMAAFVADRISRDLGGAGSILVLGLTFKEDVPDLRNSKVADMIDRLVELGHPVTVCDPLADPALAEGLYGFDLIDDPAAAGPVDAVVGAVAHAAFRNLDAAGLAALLKPGGLVADVKGMWRAVQLPDGLRRWQL